MSDQREREGEREREKKHERDVQILGQNRNTDQNYIYGIKFITYGQYFLIKCYRMDFNQNLLKNLHY